MTFDFLPGSKSLMGTNSDYRMNIEARTVRGYRKVSEGEFHEVDIGRRRRRQLGSHDVCIVAARHEWLAVRHRLLHCRLNPPRFGRVQIDLWLSLKTGSVDGSALMLS